MVCDDPRTYGSYKVLADESNLAFDRMQSLTAFWP